MQIHFTYQMQYVPNHDSFICPSSSSLGCVQSLSFLWPCACLPASWRCVAHVAHFCDVLAVVCSLRRCSVGDVSVATFEWLPCHVALRTHACHVLYNWVPRTRLHAVFIGVLHVGVAVLW